MPAASAGQECPLEGPVPLKLTPINTNLYMDGDFPVLLTHAPDDESRLFVVMRGGRVVILDPQSGEVRGTFFDLGADVIVPDADSGEHGLLGMAFHPNYPADPRVFVNYTGDTLTSGVFDTVISSLEVSSNPDVVDIGSEQILVRYAQPRTVHNGGMLAFGWDNCLYSGSGDGGEDPENGQDPATPLGKMLRIDVDAPMTRAPGNLAAPAYEHVWDLGLRNPWRFSFDRATGDMYVGDVGQDLYEEIDVSARGVGGRNFGWPQMEGEDCRQGDCNEATFAYPTSQYDHSANGDLCVIGGYVYRGAAIPSLHGWYLYADYGSDLIRAFVWDGDAPCDAPLTLSERDGLQINEGGINSFGEDAAGELYVVTTDSVFRIDAAN